MTSMPIKDNTQSNLSNLSREISLLKLGKIKKKMIDKKIELD
jgi:hypothetical protein